MSDIRIGDTANNAITINIDNDTEFNISKVVIKCGDLKKTYDYANPLVVSFTKEETATFSQINTLYIAVYNNAGEKRTADGELVFSAKRQVIPNE